MLLPTMDVFVPCPHLAERDLDRYIKASTARKAAEAQSLALARQLAVLRDHARADRESLQVHVQRRRFTADFRCGRDAAVDFNALAYWPLHTQQGAVTGNTCFPWARSCRSMLCRYMFRSYSVVFVFAWSGVSKLGGPTILHMECDVEMHLLLLQCCRVAAEHRNPSLSGREWRTGRASCRRRPVSS